ncbi:small-subunit processome [Syncephalastrum racemosum]|uniref:Small-subunit processome n=1 Tax=Syncephalastrum racemosum TaxID=13706 RepID=A0A1X2H598_SYNRA|nr:small-subunit processome [Syncephalastrum racemosum]
MPPQRRQKSNPSKTKDTNKAGRPTKGKKRQEKTSITDVYEASDDERSMNRRGHAMDDVDTYEDGVDHVDEEDDEEIDSDEAFDESDEERFENFKFSGSTQVSDKKKRSRGSDEEGEEDEEREINMNESSDGEGDDDEDEDGEGYMDLSEMLRDESEDESDKPQPKSLTASDLLPADGDDDEDEEDDEDFGMEGDSEDSSEDEEDDGRIVRFIDELDTRKRKAIEEQRERRKKRALEQRTEVYNEGEFNLPARSSRTADVKHTLDMKDLMGSMGGEDAAFSELRQSLLQLDGKGKKAMKSALSAPVPKRVQDRLDRQAAYQAASKEVSEWSDIVMQNREAEHLVFPLQESGTSTKASNATLSDKFSAQTDLEKQIEQALADAGLKDEELEAFEALKLNKLSVKEVEERQRELRMMRELMFRHEAKAKRLKKIKSKSYRKLQRKEKMKLEANLGGIAGEVDEEATVEDQMQAALERAEERMTLKHKNTSQWAKRAIARGQHDEGTRDAILEQLQRGQDLRRKIEGDAAEESDSDYSDEEKVTAELNKMSNELEADDTLPEKGVFAMKFMQDAAKREAAATKAMVDDFKDEWLREKESEDEKDESFSVVQNNPGRMTFGNNVKESQQKKGKNTDDSVSAPAAPRQKRAELSTRTSGHVETEEPKSALEASLNSMDDDEASPWLQQVESRIQGKKASKKNNSSKGKIEDRAERNSEKIKKTKKANETNADEELLDLSQALSVPKKEKKDKKAQAQAQEQTLGPAGGDVESSDEDEDAIDDSRLTFTQRDLVERAFADDDVVQEFEEEKQAAEAEEDDKMEDQTLPGWGAWGGKSVKKKQNKNRKATHIVKVKEGIKPEDRQDKKKKNVIISEKRNKKAEKYRPEAVPYPFQTLEQYERSLRAPVGKEWNTSKTVSKITKPRIITKLGMVIDPIRRNKE